MTQPLGMLYLATLTAWYAIWANLRPKWAGRWQQESAFDSFSHRHCFLLSANLHTVSASPHFVSWTEWSKWIFLFVLVSVRCGVRNYIETIERAKVGMTVRTGIRSSVHACHRRNDSNISALKCHNRPYLYDFYPVRYA